MKTCVIAPVPSLAKFVDDTFTHHLVLAHLADNQQYMDFYRDRSLLDRDYVILDNGAKELIDGLQMIQLLTTANNIRASEIVLPDVRYSHDGTIESGITALNFLLTEEGQWMYEQADKPKIMVVPQGSNPKEWKDCLWKLLEAYHKLGAARPNLVPELPVIAFAYHYDHMFDGGLSNLMKGVMHSPSLDGYEIHLLGWTRRLITLKEIARDFPGIRSVDSCKPLMYARLNWLMSSRKDYPGRADDFFTTPIAGDKTNLARTNIETFRRFANDGRSA